MYNQDTLHTSSSSPPIDCQQPVMPSTLSSAELEALSTKAISAKATAYCMYKNTSFQTRNSANPQIRRQCPSLRSLPRWKHPHSRSRFVPGPYSNFRVGACILTSSGEYIIGGNVENVSFPVATCAERVAFGTAVVCPSHVQPVLCHVLANVGSST